jgi:D-glycero-beta-D-manno-heptose-7-phosphate kinase
MTPQPERLSGLVDKLKGRKILIVGDVGLDEYVIGSVRRISPEAPVPIVEVNQEDNRLGLASNVAANVASLGGVPYLVGVVGGDSTADIFKSQLRKNNCSPEYLIVDSERPTTRKLRVMAGQHHVVRVDFERKKFLSPQAEERLISRVKELIPQCDGVILEDYAKGVLSEKVIQAVISTAHKFKKIVTLDPNRTTPVDMYKGVDYLTPNTDEALALSELKLDDLRNPSESFHEVGAALLKRLEAQGVIVTRGKEGMSAFLKEGPAEGKHIPTFARAVFDVTGAGDTVIATFTLAVTSGLSVEEACLISNYAAGVVVGKIGCVSADPTELKEYIRTHDG